MAPTSKFCGGRVWNGLVRQSYGWSSDITFEGFSQGGVGVGCAYEWVLRWGAYGVSL